MGTYTVAVSYVPANDDQALDWLEHFSRSMIEPKPPPAPGSPEDGADHFGIGADAVRSLIDLVRDFRAKLEVMSMPDRRTGPAITAKIEARNAAVRAVRPMVKLIRAHPATTPGDLLRLGLPVPQDRRKEVPPPKTAPILTIMVAGNGMHKLIYADSLTPQSRGKPDGVMHLQLYLAVGKELASHSDPLGSGAAFHSLVTRTPFTVHHDPAHNGLVATYFGRWSTRTGLTGPWSIPVGMTVSFVQRGR